MAKLILSPFLIFIIVLWPTLLICTRRCRGVPRALVLVSCIALLAVTVLSTSLVSTSLERSLESSLSDDERCPKDAVVVLSGGYALGEAAGADRLSGDSILRVMKGAGLLKRCDSKWLVLSGSSRGGASGRDVELMRDLARGLGVPDERMRLEGASANTREHVSCLERTGWFERDAELAIVSSPWHLRRAMMEFSRVFPGAYPVMAYGRPSYGGGLMWGVGALDHSTTMLHEYIGYAWYALLDRLKDKNEVRIQR